MRVKCISTVIKNPSHSLLESGWWHAEEYLTIGKEYDVYAVYKSYYYDIDAYLLCDDLYNGINYYWPLYIPTCFFVITDEKKPSFWKNFLDNPNYEGPDELIPEKYEALVNGDLEALASFHIIQELLNCCNKSSNGK